MIKIFIIIVLLITQISAKDDYELKLYERILPVIFNKNILNIYTDKKTKDIIKQSDKFNLVIDCNSATIIIGKDLSYLPNSCLEKPIFSTSYRSYKNTKNSFGAFYWRKGRPQVKFKLEMIKKFELNLPKSLRKYAK